MTSVTNLIADPGNDGTISFVEALTAINRTGGGHTITFNLPPGSTIQLDRSLYLQVPNTTIDGDMDNNDTPDVRIAGPTGGGRISLGIVSYENIIRNLVISGLSIRTANAHHNQVIGCYLGTSVTGRFSDGMGNVGVGIGIGAHHNTIGGTDPTDRNIIAGNVNGPSVGGGVALWYGAHQNEILGNWIGVNVDGDPLPNDQGVVIWDGAIGTTDTETTWGNIIGNYRTSSECTGPCNLISGNQQAGVLLRGSETLTNVVVGNYVGTNLTGTLPISNGLSGVSLDSAASRNVIGGARSTVTCTGPCNLIGGNGEAGVGLIDTGTRLNVVQGNYIGLQPNGTSALPNGRSGVVIQGGASQNTIGGARPSTACTGLCNVISGNDQDGVAVLDSGHNFVQGNYIGTEASGQVRAGLGNALEGVSVLNASNNRIGGGASGEGNRIAGNRGAGVLIARTTVGADPVHQNQVRGNEIFDNGQINVDLAPELGLGVSGDGPNAGRQPPTLYPPLYAPSYTRIWGGAAAPDGSQVDVYSEGGRTYLGSATLTSGVFNLTLGSGTTLTEPLVGTVTDPSGNTSELSGEGNLFFSAPNALPGGRVYAFGVLTESWSGQTITSATQVTLTVHGESFSLRGDGKEEDFFRDRYYSGWITAPPASGSYSVTLEVNGIPAAVGNLRVTTQPQLAVLTDLEALEDEFIRTGGLVRTRQIYSALHRLSEYAGDHNGVLLDLQQEVKRTSVTDNTPYTSYNYATGGLNHRRSMGTAIDNHVAGLAAYRSTLRHIAIVGDDAVVPYFRRVDPVCAEDPECEDDYPAEVGGAANNASLLDSRAGYILSDVPYASFDATDPNKVNRPSPDLAVARIFNATPTGLRDAIAGYETEIAIQSPAVATVLHQSNEPTSVHWETVVNNAIIPPLTRVFTPAVNVTALTVPQPITPGVTYRFNGRFLPAWTRQSVADAIPKATVSLLYSHADQFANSTQGTVGGANGKSFRGADMAALSLLPGHLLVNTGCHSGYSVSRAGTADRYSGTLTGAALDRQIAYLAPTVYGIGENTSIEYHDRLYHAFLLQTLIDPDASTVGDAYRRAQIDYNRQVAAASWDSIHTNIRYGTMLYGLPTQCFVGACDANPGTVRAVRAVRTVDAGHAMSANETHTLDIVVETPHFDVVANADGKTRFELPNTGGLAGAAHYPLLPQVTRSYLLPLGSTVTAVNLAGQVSNVYPHTVTLETATPVNRTYGPQPGSAPLTTTYPAQIYWTETAEMDDYVLLSVGINPLQYDSATQQATLYSRVALSVTYEAPASATAITGLVVNDSAPVDVGQASLPITMTVDSAATQMVTVRWQVTDAAGDVLRLGQEEMPLTAGSNAVGIATDTLGWHPGPMLLSASIDTGSGAISSDAALFTARGRSLTAATERLYYNTAPTTTVTATVHDETGAAIPGLSAALTATLDGAPVALSFAEVATGTYQAILSLNSLSEGGHDLTIELPGYGDASAGFAIDQTPPTADLDDLPPMIGGLSVPIHWSGNDSGAGIDYYEVDYFRSGDVDWTGWFTASGELDYYPSRSTAFFGPWDPVATSYGESIAFRVRAVDHVGNVGAFVPLPQAVSTTLFHNPPVDRAEAVARVIELTNEERAAQGLPPLRMSTQLNSSAQLHSDDMATSGFHDHVGSDGSAPTDRIYRAGYESRTDGENVACGATTPEQVVADWMSSPGHRANILNADFREIGIGYAFDPTSYITAETCGYHFWTQNFGARAEVFPVVINGEAEVTASPHVTLTIYGDGWASEMLVSNAPDFSSASWQAYTSTLGWTLDPATGQGERAVYVRLCNAVSETLDVSDTIILDCCAVRGADLSVTKSSTPNPVVAGDQLTYTIIVTNDGPVGADGVMLFDTLPQNVDFDEYETSHGYCVHTAGTVACSLGELDASTGVTVTLWVIPTDDAVGTITNTVRVTSYESDPDSSDNTATTVTTIKGGRADLAVTMADDVDPAVAGAPLTYAITVTNGGPATAAGVVLTDTLPGSADFGSAVSSQGTCGETGGTVTCTLGSLAAGGSLTITLVVTPTADAILSNTAVVALTGDQLDPDPSNNTATEQTQAMAAFVVNVTGDGGDTNPGDGVCDDGSGNCSLRAAIEEANAGTGTDLIWFNIAGATPHTIQPASALPTVSDPLIIDGSSEPDYAGKPVVEIDGSAAGDWVDGLTITAGNTTVRGLAINGFHDDGIFITDNDGNIIQGCFIGVDTDGATDLGNGNRGIWVFDSSNNLIGGPTAAERNVVSGNGLVGVDLGGSQNQVEGNYIGTDLTGTTAVSNTWGVFIFGAISNTVRNNLISGNTIGVYLEKLNPQSDESDTFGNVVAGNYIGTDAAGTAVLSNTQYGVFIKDAERNVIGGPAAEDGNVISGNGLYGIYIHGAYAEENVIRNNLIGLNGAGTAGLKNLSHGVMIIGGRRYVIAGNVISNNGEPPPFGAAGAVLRYCNECVVEDNLIGTDATGTVDLGNTLSGLVLLDQTTTTVRNNLISGNGVNGIEISAHSLVIQGNKIGTDIHGTAALGNDWCGISGASGATIGGTGAGEGNLVSGNGDGGICRSSNSVVQGNLIGTDINGTAALGNGGDGMSGLYNSIIGGTTPGAANVVSANGGAGVLLWSDNVMLGNLIGTDVSGTAAMGNGGAGISTQHDSNLIGGTESSTANTVAFNGGAGVHLTGDYSFSYDNAILSNQVYSNTGLGIDLGNDAGVTLNDPGDFDIGPNMLQNFPVLALADPVAGLPGGGTLVRGRLNSAATTPYTLQLYANTVCDPSGYGEGEALVGSTVVTTNVTGDAAFDVVLDPTLPTGTFVCATATNPDGNTSEFSACTLVTHWADLVIAKSGTPETLSSGETLTYTLIVTNTGPSPATGITLTDTLPGGLAFGSMTPSQGSCSGTSTIVCDLGSLVAGDRATVTLVVTATATGAWDNVATVTADQPDPYPANDTATVTTGFDTLNLSLTKTGVPSPSVVGEWLTYTLVITNHGPLTATNTVLTDTLPPRTIPTVMGIEGFEGGVVPPGGWNEEVYNTAANWTINTTDHHSGTHSAYVPYSLSQQDEWLLSPYLTGFNGGMTTTVWSAGSIYWCRDTYDNCDLDAWLVVDDTGGGDDELLGSLEDDWVTDWTWSRSTFTLPTTLPTGDLRIGFQYTGSDGADAYIDDVALPYNPNPSSAIPSQGGCVLSDTTTCDLGALATGDVATVTLVLQSPMEGTLVNTATVTADQPDVETGDNTAIVATDVHAAVELSITKTASSDRAWHGELLTYTLVAANTGPRSATDVQLVDTLSSDLYFASADPAGSCMHASSQVTCTLGTLTSGGRVTATIAVTPTYDWGQVLPGVTNIVTVTSARADGDPSDNVDWLRTPVYVPGDDNWDDQFTPSGTDEKVTDLAVDGHDVYAVGEFDIAGSASALHVAHWDGSAWHPLLDRVDRGVWDGVINAVAAHDGRVYVGGFFEQITDLDGRVVRANNVAVWDGQHWSALGSGVDAAVHVLEVDGQGTLYAGGDFTTAGGTTANRFARWDGSQWSAMGVGFDHTVSAIAVDGSDIYAGGGFTKIAGSAGDRVAHWNGTRWAEMAGGTDGFVYALAIDGSGDLYVGGTFDTAGTVSTKGIARWDGTDWYAVGGNGVDTPGHNTAFVYDLAVSNGSVCATGVFKEVGNVPANGIACWDGNRWQTLGDGLRRHGYLPWGEAVAVNYSGHLYAGGDFKTAGQVVAWNVARWDGTNWAALSETDGGNGLDIGPNTDSGIYGGAVSGSDVYVGGDFSVAGSVTARGVARWDGTAWHGFGAGVTGTVYAVATDGTDLYAAGDLVEYTAFEQIDYDIARWDPHAQDWQIVGNGGGSGVNDVIKALAFADNGDLYVGGEFQDVGRGAVTAYNLARWDGSQWHEVSNELNGGVYAIAITGTQVYVGGWFWTGDTSPGDYIAMWDGTTWHDLGGGLDDMVQTIAIADNGDVYVGGNFTTAGGVTVNGIARWDGSQWHALGSGVERSQWEDGVYDIRVDGSDVIVGGQFRRAGGVDVNNVAVWDGTRWSALGSGVVDDTGPEGWVRTIALIEDETYSHTYVGGHLRWAGRRVSHMWGCWLESSPNLAVTIADTPDPVFSGQSLTYTVTVANWGGQAASGVVLTDTLPGSVNPGSVTPSQGSCSGTNVVVCDLGTIEVDAQAEVTIVVTPTATGVIENQATATANEPDRDPADNGAIESTTVNAIDLVVTKIDSADPVLAGTALVYTLTVANAGPATATGVVLTDTLPGSVTFGSAAPSQGNCGGAGPVVCPLGTIASGGSATVTLTVTPTAVGTVLNQASVTAQEPDLNAADNETTEETLVEVRADLVLTKVVQPGTVRLGESVAYTLTVTNTGPSIATDVSLTDTLPSGVILGPVTPSQGSCGGTGPVVCDLGTLSSNGAATVTLVVTPTAAGALENAAVIAAGELDPNTGNNAANATTTVEPVADLAVAKVDSADPALVGMAAIYTLTVTNHGPSAATGIVLTDTLPVSVTLGLVAPSQGSCNGSGTVVCNLGALAGGAQAEVTVVVTPTAVGTVSNRVVIGAAEYDPDTTNNDETETTGVEPVADLEATQSDAADPTSVGAPLTYTIRVVNHGPSDATGVTLTDTLPMSATSGLITPSQGSCGGSGPAICDLGGLASGDVTTVTVVVTPTAITTITNGVEVSAQEHDPRLVNNSVAETTVVMALAEAFDYGIPPGWTVINGGTGSGATATWTTANPCGRFIGPSANPWMMVDSDCAGPGDEQDEQLISPAIDVTSCEGVELRFDSQFHAYIPNGDEIADVDVSIDDGMTWTNTLRMMGSDSGYPTPENVRLDLSDLATGHSVRLRFYYHNASYDWWWAIDDVVVVCATESAPPQVNLGVAQADAPDPVEEGQALTYTVVVTNAGPDAATGIVLTDTLPLSVTLSTVAPSQGTCGGIEPVVCELGELLGGGKATVTAVVTPTVVGMLTNTVEVSANEVDTHLPNNESIEHTIVDEGLDMIYLPLVLKE